MRIGVVSDIHSNLTALLTVLDDMGPVDALWCLGDFVGYGPWPNECIELLRERGVQAIAGNHDLAAIGTISSEEFNGDAAIAAEWTAHALTPESRAYLLTLEPMAEIEGVTFAHGSPREPVWEYMLSAGTAAGEGYALDLGHGYRSEEHTSELQSRGHLVCRHLLEKKKQLEKQ